MKLLELNFDNHFAQLGENFFKSATPSPLKNQRVVAYSASACELINLDQKELKNPHFLEKISGKISHSKFCNLAQAYAGHQFGHFVPTLGDGRAVLLAQIKNQKNESWDLVLKGSGLTAFSRPYVQNADGRAVLRSSIREFLISENMTALGIPTSRALCLIASDEIVMRETPERAAQIIRLAPSHLRFGTFEYFFYQEKNEQIRILTDYAIKQYFPLARNYAEFLLEVVRSTAAMIASWQAYGFCHGVLNTDNMSIHGITFDYGPFGFLDEYNPHHICNHSDVQGRYSFANQPAIGMWNLHAFAVTLSSLISMKEQKEILENYENFFLDEYQRLMAARLGFSGFNDQINKLIYELLDLLEQNKTDYNFFFSNIEKFSREENFLRWFENYSQILESRGVNKIKAQELMRKSNPQFILRNHLLQNAIEKAEAGDFSEVKKLQKIFSQPFANQSEFQEYSNPAPSWAKEICISCSS